MNKLKKFLKRLPRILGENAFLTFLAVIFISLVSGALVFYKYSISVEQSKPEVLEEPLLFSEKDFQDVLKTWQDRQKKFEEADLKVYLSPFRLTE